MVAGYFGEQKEFRWGEPLYQALKKGEEAEEEAIEVAKIVAVSRLNSQPNVHMRSWARMICYASVLLEAPYMRWEKMHFRGLIRLSSAAKATGCDPESSDACLQNSSWSSAAVFMLCSRAQRCLWLKTLRKTSAARRLVMV